MWKITSINNLTHAVSVTNETGDKIDLVIPDTHRDHSKSLSYIKEQTDAHDATNPPVSIAPVIQISSAVSKTKTKPSYYRWSIVALLIAVAAIVIILKV